MLPSEILQSDMLDILFENRNKNYGAYALRRSYNKRLASAVIGTFLIASVFTTVQLLHHPKTHDPVTLIDIIDDPHLTRVEVIKPEPILPVTPAVTHSRQTDHQTPVIVKEVDAIQQPTIEDIENGITSDVNADGEAPPDIPVTGESNNVHSSAISLPAPVIEDVPVFNAQVMPEFPGGTEALRKFILKNTRQPDDLRPGEKILVLASFIVSKNGSIEHIKIINSGRTDLDKEVMRVIDKMPLWKPGMQNGHQVSVYFNLPVTFMGAEE